MMGCAATADFVELTKEVTYVRNEQKELKVQVAELKKLATDIAARQKRQRPAQVGSRLDELTAKLESIAAAQTVSDSVLTELRRDHGEAMRRIASVPTGVGTSRAPTNTAPGRETTSDSGTDTTACAPADMPEMEPEIQAFVPPDDATQDQIVVSPREAFQVAYQDYQAGDYESAIQGFNAFQQRFPEASLVVDAQYLVGTAYFRTRDCSRAVSAYEKMVSTFPKLSYLYDAMGNRAQARSVLLRLIDGHPRSKEAKLARQRLPDVSQ
jgi:TolA-binding protein